MYNSWSQKGSAIAKYIGMQLLAGLLQISCEAARLLMREKLIKIATSSGPIPFGLFLLVIFIVAMKQPLHEQPSSAKHYTYLALGDSYTIGEKVEARESFPYQVVGLLKEKGFMFQEPKIIAQTGWTTNELQAAIKKANHHRHYDFVTILIGVNNQYRGRKVADYIPEFELLLKQAIQFAGNDTDHVIVLSIPDWGVTPFAEDRNGKQIAKEIDEYNAANELIASKYKVHYINITKSTREAAKDTSLLTQDGLHPSGKEYSKWAKEVAGFIQSKL
jgi:lysophospholipase L1-like esterase